MNSQGTGSRRGPGCPGAALPHVSARPRWVRERLVPRAGSLRSLSWVPCTLCSRTRGRCLGSAE
eukprot:2723276-Pyramimonas_sp.AAC.1